MARDFAFIQTSPGRAFVGWGPFEQLPFRRPGRPAFFLTDFFLDEPRPWRHPAEWEEVALDELADRFHRTPPQVQWHPVRFEPFADVFASAGAAMARGDFSKVVPVVFENGRIDSSDGLWNQVLTRVAALPAGLHAYGWSIEGHSLAGATPEVLFETHGHGYTTMALAGTRALGHAGELLRDPKELREHRVVVDDIVRRLAPFGNVEIGALGILKLPRIAHLITPIFFRESGTERMSFSEMVRRLHPTAALGVWPRNEAGERWLRESDRETGRGSFGAPFGFEREGRLGLALVGIRNVEWNETSIRIGSGAGVLAESRLEQEFDELRQKREQVKSLFGLGREAGIESRAENVESRG